MITSSSFTICNSLLRCSSSSHAFHMHHLPGYALEVLEDIFSL